MPCQLLRAEPACLVLQGLLRGAAGGAGSGAEGRPGASWCSLLSEPSGFQFSAPHPKRAGPRWQRGRSWFSALSFLPRRTKDSNARPPSRNGDSLGRDSLEGRRREGLCEKCPSALDVFSDPLFREASLSPPAFWRYTWVKNKSSLPGQAVQAESCVILQ